MTTELAGNENPDFTSPAPEATIQNVAAALRANNIDAQVVDSGEDARRLLVELVPEGAEVHSGKSKTLQDLGLFEEFFESGRYESVQGRYMKMDRQTQGREIRKLTVAPDYMLGSVQAVTEGGDLVVASASASQLGRTRAGPGASSWWSAARRSCATSNRPCAASSKRSSPTRTPSSASA